MRVESNDELARVYAYADQHRDALGCPRQEPIAVTLHRKVYLSTLYRVTWADERRLLAIKHHDPGCRRARREHQVLSLLGDTLSARAVLLDDSGTTFADPVLVTSFERPAFVKEWTDAHLARLARIMASIHTNQELLHLPIDAESPREYSLAREFEDEIADVPTFRDTPLRALILEMAATVREQFPQWAPVVEDGVVTYIHSDLPHHHLFAIEPEWKTVHWEWSRRSHPTRELARALWDMELPADREAVLLEQYEALVPYPISRAALEIQRLLQYFYNCIHVGFWLDRTDEDTSSANWVKAERLASVVKLWIQMQLQHAA